MKKARKREILMKKEARKRYWLMNDRKIYGFMNANLTPKPIFRSMPGEQSQKEGHYTTLLHPFFCWSFNRFKAGNAGVSPMVLSDFPSGCVSTPGSC